MEASRAFVAKFTSRKGHRTIVDETVLPAITLETVKPHRHEIVTEAIDREVHQHHYHTTVQPLTHEETLPTKHTHNLVPEIKKDHTHLMREKNLAVRALHEKEMAQFVSSSITMPTEHSRIALPAVVGEHVHHHVHEVVQPVIFKETFVPETVHTTIAIHEVHRNEPIHHQMSELPIVTMTDFLTATKTRAGDLAKEEYDGMPRPYNTKLNTMVSKYRPTPINTTAANAHHTAGPLSSETTPPMSPASAASSPRMPSTPKHVGTGHGANVRTSEDNYGRDDFSLNSPGAMGKTEMNNTGRIEAPRRALF